MVGIRPAQEPGPDFREALGKHLVVSEVKAINGTRVTVLRPDGVTQNISVNENTSFRKGEESITLADVKIGDHVFGRGEAKKDVFVPVELNIGEPAFMAPPPDGASEPQ